MLNATRSIFSVPNAPQNQLVQLGIPTETEWIEEATGSELQEQMDAIKHWYRNNWIALDNKLHSP